MEWQCKVRSNSEFMAVKMGAACNARHTMSYVHVMTRRGTEAWRLGYEGPWVYYQGLTDCQRCRYYIGEYPGWNGNVK